MNEERESLTERVALITGSASGIGLATARLFLERGARVALSDVKAADVEQLAPGHDGRAIYLTLDVARAEHWTDAMRQIEARWGRLDVLVNCAGITGGDAPQDPDAVSLQTWRRVHEVNVEGVLLGSQAATPLLRKSRSAAIVNVSSYAAIIGVPGACAYAASKAAVSSLTRSLALHFAERGDRIRCNCVLPGAIRTPMWESYLGEGAQREQRIREAIAGIPLARIGEPDEVAAAIAFLASDAAGFITGMELMVDGGQSVRA